MTRRARSNEADDPTGSPAGKGRWWIFPVVAGGIVAFWVVMSLPRAENDEGVAMPYTTKRAGWPDHFSRWSVRNDTGETTFSSFSTGALLGNLVLMALPIIAAWVVIRHLNGRTGESVDREKVRHPKTTNDLPPRGTASGGWG